VGWSVAPDAKGFLFATTPNGGRPAPFTVMLNFMLFVYQKTFRRTLAEE
jgi:hypothetical protein